MFKFALIIVLALAVSASSDFAQTDMDCEKAYKSFWERVDRERITTVSGEQLAAISRMALDAHDACQAGDEGKAEALYSRITLRDGHPDRSTGPFNPNLPDR